MKFAFEFSEIEDEIVRLRTSLEEVEGEGEEWFQKQIDELQAKLELARQLLKDVPQANEKQLEAWYKCDLLEIPLPQRWMMYNSWRLQALANLEQQNQSFGQFQSAFVCFLLVIVEEAAEVLEAHVVCSLSDSCEQLILIGNNSEF